MVSPKRAAQLQRAPEAKIVATPVVKWVGGKTKLLPELLARMPKTFGRYYEPFIGGAATFIYLNKTCFNGLWRGNRAGDFNVPIGRYSDPPILVPEALRAASSVLARADIRNADYQTAIEDAKAGDILYFDPPYEPITPTASFTSYTAGDFGPDDQRALAATAKQLLDRGCKVMLSNSDTAFIRSLYKGLKIDKVKCSRAINSNAAKRGEVDELVITGGY